MNMATFSGVAAETTPPDKDLLSLAEALLRGETTASLLTEHALKRAAACSSFNIFITIDAEGAHTAAAIADRALADGTRPGPLHGLPVVVKDNIHVAGLPNSAGTVALRGFVPTQDATVVSRLRNAGAIVLGKTNLHELAFGITSDNATFGAVGNAHCPEMFAGGSSGGTAIAVALGIAAGGLGTDTGGSVRIPAALNGVVGFRPTTGRYPSDGLTRISQTRDTVGPMANTVSGVALLDQVLSASVDPVKAADLTHVRLGVPRAHFFAHLQPDIRTATEELFQSLQRAGVTLVEADIHDVGELSAKVGFPIVLYESARLLESYLERYQSHTSLATMAGHIASPDVNALFVDILGEGVSEPDYLEALNTVRPRLQAAYRDHFAHHDLDAIIFPTTPLTARPIAGSVESVMLNGARVPTFPTYIQNTDPGSNAGIPGLSIPLSRSEQGLPFGIEIDGPHGSDQRLLAIGMAMETVINTQATTPNSD